MNNSSISSILFITREQYGYLTDLVRWVESLESSVAITVVCLDQQRKKVEANENVKIIYCRGENKLSRWLNLLRLAKAQAPGNQIVFTKYFPGASLVVLGAGRRKSILDFRTLSVSKSAFMRFMQNSAMRLESSVARNLTGVSTELLRALGRPDGRVVGLGGDNLHLNKTWPEKEELLNLLYLGTLDGRDIEVLLEATCDYIKMGSHPKIALRLAGTGSAATMAELHRIVFENHTENDINFLGFLTRSEIVDELGKSDIGIVHVPNAPRYKVQPSTKLFEYWGANMPVLASDYPMNRRYVEPGCGILYEPSEAGFLKALTTLSDLVTSTNRQRIAILADKYSWDKQLVSLRHFLEGVARSSS